MCRSGGGSLSRLRALETLAVGRNQLRYLPAELLKLTQLKRLQFTQDGQALSLELRDSLTAMNPKARDPRPALKGRVA